MHIWHTVRIFRLCFIAPKINTKADQFQSDHSTRQTYSVHCFKRQLLWPFKFIQVLSAFSDSIPFRYPSFELDVKRCISILPENIFSCGHCGHAFIGVSLNKLLNKQWNCRWFWTSSRWCDLTLMDKTTVKGSHPVDIMEFESATMLLVIWHRDIGVHLEL